MSIKVAIASGKGGTGKTTLAVNLTAFMAKHEHVILADLDVEEPNTSLFLESELVHQESILVHVPRWDKDACTFCGLCQNVCNFNAVFAMPADVIVLPELCHSCYACSDFCPSDALPMVARNVGKLLHLYAEGCELIEGRLDVGEEKAVPAINRALDYLSDHVQEPGTVAILDAPPGTACPVVAATRVADFVILVTEPTPFGLHDLTIAVDLMRDLEKDFAVVINRFGIGNNDVFTYCEEQSIPILAKIPNSRKIAELYSRGDLIFREVPEMQIALEKIATSIRDRVKEAIL